MVDVCLVLEGTYPYLTGGVSSWVHEHVEALDEISFCVTHLRDDGDPVPFQRYQPPANVSVNDVLLDPERDLPDPYLAAALPEAGAYHALATGFAGVVASGAADLHGRPFLLTEHGLAWHEAGAGITGCRPHRAVGAGCSASAAVEARDRRAALVRAMARDSYARADAITTVCEHNRRRQQRAGAKVERLGVIPNAARSTPRSLTRDDNVFRVGLVARVVAIKDVLSFIRACAMAGPLLPSAEFVVIGPDDHEAEYAARCRELTAELGLSERLTFTGETDPTPWYPLLDAVVLTSISEAQPRVLLEAMAAGIPVVATDVGGCNELIGRDAGVLTQVGDHRATARALVVLGRDRLLREQMGAAGRMRVAMGYAIDDVNGAWRQQYRRWLDAPVRLRS